MRIATYGCSFTQYRYPTYATILACDYHVRNRGKPGCGNDYIFYQIMNDYKKGILDSFDLVVVQWTGFTRWNYLAKNGWIGMDGSVFNVFNKESKKTLKKIKSFYNTDFEKQKFLNYYYCANSLLGSKCITLSYEKSDLDFVTIDNMFEEYKGDYIFQPTDFNENTWTDDHPTVAQHLTVAQKIANISENTQAKALQCDKTIRMRQKFDLITSL